MKKCNTSEDLVQDRPECLSKTHVADPTKLGQGFNDDDDDDPLCLICWAKIDQLKNQARKFGPSTYQGLKADYRELGSSQGWARVAHEHPYD